MHRYICAANPKISSTGRGFSVAVQQSQLQLQQQQPVAGATLDTATEGWPSVGRRAEGSNPQIEGATCCWSVH